MKARDVFRWINRKWLKRSPRSRILIDEQEERVAIANYKCGFTSMNRCLAGWNTKIDEPGGLRRWLKAHPDAVVHMIVRDPVTRFQSFVHDWLFDKGPVYRKANESRERENFAFSNLADLAGAAVSDKVSNLRAAGDLEGIYRVLVDGIPLQEYIEKNEHTAAQADLVTISGGEFLPVHYFYELDSTESMAQFSERLNVEFPHSNRSSRQSGEVSEAVVERVREIYGNDYRLFGSILRRRPPQ